MEPTMTLLRLLSLICVLVGCATAAEPVMVGGGSYAPADAGVIDGDGQKLLRIVPQIEPELKNRPLPTNDWWTSLLTGPFPGKVYAMPATIDATAAGVRIWYPQGWNPGGTELEAGSPLEINAVDPTPPKTSGDVVIAAFDGDAWPRGWSASGAAWGPGPTALAKRAMGGGVGRGYACSITGEGDRGTGELTSPSFTIDPIHIFGIQWLPQWTYMQYLARDPAFTAWQVGNMLTAQGSKEKGTSVTFSILGDDWGNVALGAMQFGDVDLVAKTLDESAAANDPLAGWKHGGVTYYLTHAYRSLGRIAWDCSTSLPTSTVFSKDGKLTVVAWNPDSKPVTVTVFLAAKQLGQITVPGGATQAFHVP